MPPIETGLILRPEEIRARISALAEEISHDYAGRTPLVVGVLKGSVPFMADLVRRTTVPIHVDFMSISSYASGSGAGVVRILKDLDTAIQGRDVIVVEDIIDTGLTITYLMANLRARAPRSLEICALLDKSVRRIIEVPIRYKGFDIPDEYVVGYGLDHEGRYRNLRGIVGIRNVEALAGDPAPLALLFD